MNLEHDLQISPHCEVQEEDHGAIFTLLAALQHEPDDTLLVTGDRARALLVLTSCGTPEIEVPMCSDACCSRA